jgi:hypothetical protein
LNKIIHKIISIIVKWVAFSFVKGVIKEVFVYINNRGDINVNIRKGLSSLFLLRHGKVKGLVLKKFGFQQNLKN